MNETAPAAQPQTAATDPSMVPLRKRVITGSVWTLASYGGSQLLRLGGNLIFARLLFPEAFGLMALVNVFVQGLTMFSDIGIGPSIIQNKRGEDPAFLNSAWSIQVVRGALLWIASALGAAPFAAWYGEPQLASLIPVAALAALISGFTSTKLFSGERRIALARITVIDFSSQTIGLVSMVAWCFVTRSVWAIVFGGLIGTATKTLLTHLVLPGERNRFAIEREAFRELTRFGRWIFVSTALAFLTSQVDRLLLGKFVNIDQLGVYSIAINLASLAPTIALMLTGTVLFPLLAHHSRTDAKAYEQALFGARAMILKGALFVLAGLALFAPAFFGLLYDSRYSEAAWIAQLLTVPMWVWMLMLSADRAALAAGNSKALAISNACSLAGKLVGCSVGYHFAGLAGFILGLAFGNALGHLPIVLALRRMQIHVLRQDLPYTGAAVGILGGGVLVQRLAARGLEGHVSLLVQSLVALVILVPLGWKTALHAKQVIGSQ
ncbi:MAG: oligosaccharide flippase family protein [Planctomycetes bacterium]|nr:oligosaccharide flippase family protein [Planctomycetota bacterium]